MARRRVFGELELSILKVVKERGSVTVRDVVGELDSQSRYTTVMTVMSRLAEKGELCRAKKGRQFVYQLSEQSNQRDLSLLARLQSKLFDGKAVSMVSYLLNSSEDLTIEELQEIESLVHSLRKDKES